MTNLLPPVSANDGAYLADQWILGDHTCGRLLGHDRETNSLVHIGITRRASVPLVELDARLSYDVPGVSRCQFVGAAEPSSSVGDKFVVIESMAELSSLTRQREHLDNQARLHVSTQIARAALQAVRRDVVLGGIHPDLAWVNKTDFGVTLTPRFPVLIAVREHQRSTGPGTWPFSDMGPFVDPTMLNLWFATAATDAYHIGLLVSWIFTGQHPFADVARRRGNDWLTPMQEDERDLFTGPPAIGRILDRLLVADPTKRMPVDEVVTALEEAEFAVAEFAPTVDS
jgi:hypothetical protein